MTAERALKSDFGSFLRPEKGGFRLLDSSAVRCLSNKLSADFMGRL